MRYSIKTGKSFYWDGLLPVAADPVIPVQE